MTLGLHGLLLATMALSVAACAPRGPTPTGVPPGAPLYVVSNGWHSGIVISRQLLPAAVWPDEGATAPRYLEFGWGDQAAYLADRLTTRLALGAAFGSSSTALHVVAFDHPVTEQFRTTEIVEMRVEPPRLEALGAFLRASYARDRQGAPIWLARGYAPRSAFYLATGRYHLFNTCNTWTAKALRAAGVPLAAALILTADQLMDEVRPFGRVIRPRVDPASRGGPGPRRPGAPPAFRTAGGRSRVASTAGARAACARPEPEGLSSEPCRLVTQPVRQVPDHPVLDRRARHRQQWRRLHVLLGVPDGMIRTRRVPLKMAGVARAA